MSKHVPPGTPSDFSVDLGRLVASFSIPRTFARSLSAQTALGQGLLAGLATGLPYLLAVATQDALRAAAAPPGGEGDRWSWRRTVILLADVAAIPLGLAVQRALPSRPGDPLFRGLLRQAGWRVMTTGVGGTLLLASESGTRALDDRMETDGRLAPFPVAVPVGLGIALLLDRRRALPNDADSTT